MVAKPASTKRATGAGGPVEIVPQDNTNRRTTLTEILAEYVRPGSIQIKSNKAVAKNV